MPRSSYHPLVLASFLAAAFAACSDSATAPRNPAIVAGLRHDLGLTGGGIYYLHNACGGRVLDVGGASTNDGARVQLWDKWNGANQQWTLTPVGDGSYTLTSVNSGKVLDAFGWDTTKGAPVGQWTANGGANQHWRVTDVGSGYAKLNPVYAPNKALDVQYSGTGNGTPVWLWDDNGSCAQQWHLEPVGGGSPSPTFDSEFDTLDLSSAGAWQPNMSYVTLDGKWTTDGKSADGPTEALFYVNPNYAPLAAANPFSVSNGVLDITTKVTPAGINPALVNNKSYVSGLLQTQKSFSQLYGYFEMRAELPIGNGVGAAFWLLPEDGSWPPEIDVMENLGEDPGTVYQTLHDPAQPHVEQTQATVAVSGGNVAAGYHTYGVDWEADSTTFYVDGQRTRSFATPDAMRKPMYMILSNNATPASLPDSLRWGKPVDGTTKFPVDFKVDYVRAYASKPDLSSGGSRTARSSISR